MIWQKAWNIRRLWLTKRKINWAERRLLRELLYISWNKDLTKPKLLFNPTLQKWRFLQTTRMTKDLVTNVASGIPEEAGENWKKKVISRSYLYMNCLRKNQPNLQRSAPVSQGYPPLLFLLRSRCALKTKNKIIFPEGVPSSRSWITLRS